MHPCTDFLSVLMEITVLAEQQCALIIHCSRDAELDPRSRTPKQVPALSLFISLNWVKVDERGIPWHGIPSQTESARERRERSRHGRSARRATLWPPRGNVNRGEKRGKNSRHLYPFRNVRRTRPSPDLKKKRGKNASCARRVKRDF